LLFTILLTKFRNLAHRESRDLNVSSRLVLARQIVCQIKLWSKVDSDLFAARPIAHYLFWQIVSQSGDENRNDLRRRILNSLADAGLRREK
jgi:hypothetical protein